jgi:hypothetical protein
MRRKFRLTYFVIALLPLGSFSVHAQGAKSQIAAEIARLQDSLQKDPIADPDLAPVAASASQSLAAASAALQSGKLYLSLERLLQAEDLLSAARFPVQKAQVVKSGYSAFEAEWKTVSQSLAALNQQSRNKDWSTSPAAICALAETALARCVPLLDGGRGFALSTKPADGLLYLGQAQGEATFAHFASALPISRNAAPFPQRSYLPELHKLQTKTNQAFKPPRSVKLHERFIALNSALKLAQELDAQKSYAGSLYQYLEATRHFAMLDAPPVALDDQPSLRANVAAALKRYAVSKHDDSILQIFLERAVSQITHTDGSAPTADEWRSAKVILDDILPAYVATKKPAAALPQSNAKTVQLTLVRWPYT